MTNKDAANRAERKTDATTSSGSPKRPRQGAHVRARHKRPRSSDDSSADLGNGSNDVEVVFEPDFSLIAAMEAELGPPPDLRRGHYVIDPGLARAEAGDDVDPEESDATVSSEEAARLRRLRRLAADPDILYKPHLLAGTDTLARLEQVRALAPNASSAVDILIGAARISAATGTPIEMPPVVLLGPPGTGKSRVIRELGRALGIRTFNLLGSTMADASPILGTGIGWRGAAPGRLAEDLLASSTSAILGFVDEIEKMRIWDRRSHGSDILLGLLDADMAASHRDNYYQLPMRADKVIWFFAANSLDELSAPFLDRCIVCEMRPPDCDEHRAIVRRIHVEVVARLGLDPEAWLDDREADFLVRDEVSLRRVAPLIRLALGRAMTADRERISVEDLAWARAVVEHGRVSKRGRIGF